MRSPLSVSVVGFANGDIMIGTPFSQLSWSKFDLRIGKMQVSGE
jgi:hypothetical protein